MSPGEFPDPQTEPRNLHGTEETMSKRPQQLEASGEDMEDKLRTRRQMSDHAAGWPSRPCELVWAGRAGGEPLLDAGCWQMKADEKG